MKCRNCQSERVADVSAKCSDCCNVSIGAAEEDGYVPRDIGIGGGDYINFSYCLECGQLQGKFPLASAEIEKESSEDPEDKVGKFFDDNLIAGALVSCWDQEDRDCLIKAAEEFVSEHFAEHLAWFFARHNRPTSKVPSRDQFVEQYQSGLE
jgi:hypothetical protein